ncbi:MAG: septum formation initiator family protein [Clostridiales bacterium]|jgi:cell division protein FtsB|uniref:FtsB family cell division protein n=1 Tax=Clostridia TaxID=186801 RepID=UPI0018A9AC43|nr:septum formation initiator family protein [Clostridium sp. 1001270J_160509_D11]MDU1203389.1 septum formation initiator family protein [Clostridiales bacterium]
MNLRKKFSGQYMLICMFAFFIIFSLIIGVIVQLQNIRDYKEQITTLKYELDDTEKQLKSVKNSKAYKNDAELEDLARNQLGMVKQNEIIYLEK